jgi:hypothetical protein
MVWAGALSHEGRLRYGGGQMTKFVVDCGVALQLASEGFEVPAGHELLAPTLLRSQTLSALHEAVQQGKLEPEVALNQLTRIRVLPIRLLGDAVLRRRAWDLADQLGWAEPTTPSTSPSRNCRRMRSSPWTTTWRVGSKGSSPRRPSRPCERPDAGGRAAPGDHSRPGRGRMPATPSSLPLCR